MEKCDLLMTEPELRVNSNLLKYENLKIITLQLKVHHRILIPKETIFCVLSAHKRGLKQTLRVKQIEQLEDPIFQKNNKQVVDQCKKPIVLLLFQGPMRKFLLNYLCKFLLCSFF